MTVDSWLRTALAEAESRGQHDLKPLLEALAGATRALRQADVLRQEPVPVPDTAPAARRPVQPARSNSE